MNRHEMTVTNYISLYVNKDVISTRLKIQTKTLLMSRDIS